MSQQAYTPDGLLASLTIARSNSVADSTSYAYDGFDRLGTATYPGSSTETYGYDADSNPLTRKTRKGDTITFTYDTLNRLSTKAAPSEATVSYGYDLAGHVTAVNDNSAAIPVPAATASFAQSAGYDALNRPIAIGWSPAAAQATPTASSVTFTHTYDQNSRRVGQSATDNSWWSYPTTAGTVAYTPNNLNQYGTVGSVTPTYDGNGNLTYDGNFTYGYDAESRLTSVTQGSTTVATYAYDAQGRRKAKTVGATTTLYVTDADNREVLEYDGTSGAVQRWYSFGPGPDAVLNQMNVAAGTRATLIPDIQGSIIGALGSNGTLTKVGYQTFGQNPALAANGFYYTGRRLDPETAGSTAQPSGVYYYRARMYSPTWGRFMQPDPIGYAGGSNFYAYTDNDPLNQTDPNGQTSIAEYIRRGVAIIRNSSLDVHPKTGVPFVNGFPDFSSVATHTVQLEQITGTSADTVAANALAGLDSTPAGYTWHHAENGIPGDASTTMQLVPSDIHGATGHTGTAALARALGGLAVDIATDPTTYMSVGVGTFLSGMTPSTANAGEDDTLRSMNLGGAAYSGPANPPVGPGK